MDVPTVGLGRLAVALLIGLLIGLDRERAEARKAYSEFAGVRTFPLVALAGALPMLVWDSVGPWLLPIAFLGIAAIVVLSYHRLAVQGHVGATTEVAAIVTFLLGVLAGVGQLLLASATGIAVAVLLVAKPRIEAFSHALRPEELHAVLELAVISVVVLPLLPNHGYGPWQFFNPRNVWLMVVLVAGLSFAGFLAVRLVGDRRGLTVTGAVGGLVSSTAVTMALSDRSKERDDLAGPAAAATVFASTIMPARVGVLVGAIAPAMLPRIAPVLAVMVVGGVIAGWAVSRRGGSTAAAAAGDRIRNPFSLREALTWAAIYAGILFLAKAASASLISGGLYVVAMVSAIADVDAVTIAYAKLGSETGQWREVAAGIALAVVMNTVVKLGIAWVRGSHPYRRLVAVGLGAMAVAGAAAGVLMYASA